jgi:hypothetical protein
VKSGATRRRGRLRSADGVGESGSARAIFKGEGARPRGVNSSQFRKTPRMCRALHFPPPEFFFQWCHKWWGNSDTLPVTQSRTHRLESTSHRLFSLGSFGSSCSNKDLSQSLDPTLNATENRPSPYQRLQTKGDPVSLLRHSRKPALGSRSLCTNCADT